MARNSYIRFVKNTGLFAAANLSSKILQFVFVPFYTYFLSTSEYGTVDTLTSTVNLMLPLILIGLQEAVMRYVMDNRYNKEAVLINCMFPVFMCMIIFLSSYFVFIKIPFLKNFWGLFYIILIFQALQSFLQYFSRGIGKVVIFAVSGIIQTAVLVLGNLLLLAVFHMGVNGYLLAMMLSYLASSVFLIIGVKLWKYLHIKALNRKLMKQLFIFSIPLIPNSMMWWVLNASDRYIITAVMGVSYTGIYAVSHKIPTVINMCNSIIHSAWQISATEEYSQNKEGTFFTKVYTIILQLLFLFSSALLVIVKPLVIYLVSGEYESSWKYAPLLIIAAVFTSCAGFLGANYLVALKTGGALKTSAIAAAVNLIISFFLTPIIGMYGTALGTAISALVLWIMRICDTGKYVNMKFDIRNMVINIGIISIQSMLLLLQMPFYYIWSAILFVTLAVCNHKTVKECMLKAVTFISSQFPHR